MKRRGSPAPPAILLMGPTASGKTGLAMELHRRFPVELISVDSAQVYRGMDIGTAKPSPRELAEAPHRLINICDPRESYSAARFREDALREMEAILDRGRIPLLVGGTMLYFRALQRGLSPLPEADQGMRMKIEAEARERGWPALHADLRRVDPDAAARIHPNDPQRLQRALEVWRLTGRPLSQWQRQPGQKLPYRLLKLALLPGDRALLHRRIEARFRDMLERGLEAEVEGLRALPGLTAGHASMRSVGYRQVWRYLSGEGSRQEMIERAVIATRQLAKRQFTWLRAEPDLVCLDGGDMLHRALRETMAFLDSTEDRKRRP